MSSATGAFQNEETRDRLTKAEEGDWSGSAITSRSRQELWTLDEVGNATLHKLDINGNNNFGDSGDLNDTRVFNNPNELSTQDINSISGVDYTLTYNKLGQTTDDGHYNEYVYDGFGRLKTINNQSHNPVEQFSYDGLGHRISWKYDTDTDGDVDGSDKTFKLAYDERWRVVATYHESDTTPKEEYFYHAAGDGGMGGSSYIDAVVARQKDANTAWTTTTDGVLEQRYYYLQNWRADVIAAVNSSNAQVEGDRYFAAGVSFGMFAGDVNGDGNVNATDTSAIQTVITGGGYDELSDMDRNGAVTTADKTTATTNIGTNLGIGRASAPTVFNRKAYAG